jgi:membrane protease subunit (stomatin/prohibitin family)
MGIFGFGKQDIQREFIVRPEDQKNEIVWKWPDENIRLMSQLTVEQDEACVFFRSGQVVGVVPPGLHTLQSSEIPFIGDLVDKLTGGQFLKTELYFVLTREVPSLPFGGAVDSVADPETGLAVTLRVFGDYSLKATDPATLILNLVGTENIQTNDQITDWIRDQLLKVFRTDVVSHIGAQGWPILGIAGHSDAIEQETLQRVQAFTVPYGIQVARMGNFTISLSDEDAATLKKFREQAAYTRLAGGFQQAAVGEALQGIGQGAAQGGGAVNPALLGVGFGLGGQLTGAAAGAAALGAAGAAGAPPAVQVRCLKCGTLNSETAKFCSNCGQSLQPPAAAAPAAEAPPA